MSNKFPQLIHVTEEKPGNDEPYLVVHRGGVMYIDEPQEVAIYKRVSVGRLEVNKRFVLGKKKSRR